MAMYIHRNWGLPTAAAILLTATWSFWKYLNRQNTLILPFIFILFFIEGALLTTTWHGGELVYRYGLGVMSLPHSENAGHHHSKE